jgi:hypothetical protein
MSQTFLDGASAAAFVDGLHLDEQMVRVLSIIGHDVGFCRDQGQYLYDREWNRQRLKVQSVSGRSYDRVLVACRMTRGKAVFWTGVEVA